MAEHDVEAIWHNFWIPILDEASEGKPMGRFISVPSEVFDQIKREMADYHLFLRQIPPFFDDITGGKATKINTDLNVISQLVDERIKEEVAWRLEEELDIKQIEADDDAWQKGYDLGHADGRERGFEDGIDEARNRI